MKLRYKIAIAGFILAILAVAGLRIYLARTPLIARGPGGLTGAAVDPNTKTGCVVNELTECAYKQKDLYQYIETYRTKHRKLPADTQALINDDPRCMYCTYSPSKYSCRIHPENYGDPNAVFISEEPNTHGTTMALWLRGLKPNVQTMGDGTIQLFEDGKLFTVNAKKK